MNQFKFIEATSKKIKILYDKFFVDDFVINFIIFLVNIIKLQLKFSKLN